MSFSASLFFPERAKQFDFTLSEKFNWFSILTIILYPLLLIFIEKSFGCEISSYAYYVLILPFITYIIGGAIRLNEYENLNGHFIGFISFGDNFLAILTEQYDYSKIENLIVTATPTLVKEMKTHDPALSAME